MRGTCEGDSNSEEKQTKAEREGERARERRRPEGDATERATRKWVRCAYCNHSQVHHDEYSRYGDGAGIFLTKCDYALGGCGRTYRYTIDQVFEQEFGPWGDTYANVADRKRSKRTVEEDESSGESPEGYLESSGNIVDESDEDSPSHWEAISVAYEARACGCSCRFCPTCAVPLGLKLRERLIERIKTWPHLQMWTLTVDPTLFDTPLQAFLHVRRERSISELVRSLRKKKLLENEHYFCVVEWQERTEMAHYHLLVSAQRIPFAVACDIWNRNRPIAAGPVEGKRPGFGSIRFSNRPFLNGEHAANYATKYVIKHPPHGFPDWVLDNPGQIRRYSTSHGFWGTGSKPRPVEAVRASKPDKSVATSHSDVCFCPFCRGEAEEDTPVYVPAKPLRERIKTCGTRGVVMRVTLLKAPDGKFVTKHDYEFPLPQGMKAFLADYDGKPDDRRVVPLTEAEVIEVARIASARSAA